MKVNVNITLDDTQRRKVRAAGFGLKGKASRNEVRVWINELMKKSLDSVPEPKVRKPLVMDDTPASDARFLGISTATLNDGRNGTSECSVCHRSLSEHQGAKRHCPLSRSVKPGSVFRGA